MYTQKIHILLQCDLLLQHYVHSWDLFAVIHKALVKSLLTIIWYFFGGLCRYFFIQSPNDGYFVSTTNKAWMKVVWVSLRTCLSFSRKLLQERNCRVLGYATSPASLDTIRFFSTMLVPVYTTTRKVWRYLFLYILSNPGYCHIFKMLPLWFRWDGISHFHFLNDEWSRTCHCMLLTPQAFSLVNCQLLSIVCLPTGLVGSFRYVELLIYSGCYPLLVTCTYSSPPGFIYCLMLFMVSLAVLTFLNVGIIEWIYVFLFVVCVNLRLYFFTWC